jgi:hypothetical protein
MHSTQPEPLLRKKKILTGWLKPTKLLLITGGKKNKVLQSVTDLVLDLKAYNYYSANTWTGWLFTGPGICYQTNRPFELIRDGKVVLSIE